MHCRRADGNRATFNSRQCSYHFVGGLRENRPTVFKRNAEQMSDLYPGLMSNKSIVERCEVLKQMQPGDLVIANKGFLVYDLLPLGVSLNIPPFLVNPQFSAQEVETTRVTRA